MRGDGRRARKGKGKSGKKRIGVRVREAMKRQEEEERKIRDWKRL